MIPDNEVRLSHMAPGGGCFAGSNGPWRQVVGRQRVAGNGCLAGQRRKIFTPPASLPSVSQAVDVCLEHGVAVGAGSVAVGRVVGVETAAGLPCVGHAVVVGVGWGG